MICLLVSPNYYQTITYMVMVWDFVYKQDDEQEVIIYSSKWNIMS